MARMGDQPLTMGKLWRPVHRQFYASPAIKAEVQRLALFTGQDISLTPDPAPSVTAQAMAHGAVRRVLLVDDSRVQRKILSTSLRRWGYAVIEAGSALEALEICRHTAIDVVVSDWMMPGMSGLEFCSAFRVLHRDSYGYFILLTSKSDKGEIARGLDAGADDFLAKPVSADELRARITAGERILRMEQELREKNRLVTTTLAEIQTLYDSLNRDLVEARKLQQSLVRERHHSFGNADVSLLLRPSGHVGGDLVGFFSINHKRVGLFSIDVSGHGVTSALMTARLAGFLSSSSPERNIALYEEDGIFHARPPHEVAAHLNRLLMEEIETENYFTLLYADLNLATGRVSMVQAGHPHPAVQRSDGTVEYLGTGGLPIGLLADANYESFDMQLNPGDRLFLMSDGFTECADMAGNELGEAGLTRLLQRNAALRGEACLEALIWDLQAYAGEQDFHDDVSGVLFEFGMNKVDPGLDPRDLLPE